MGDKTRGSGSQNPAIGSKPRLIVAAVAAGMMGVGVFAEFIPAPILQLRHVWLPLLLMGVGFAVWVLLSRSGREYVMSTVNGRFLRALAVLSLPLVYSMMGWLALARGLPWLYTAAVGVPVQETDVMLTVHQHSRWSCDWRVTAANVGERPYLCISLDAYTRHPDQWVQVVLRGKRSVLGMNVQQVIVGDAAPAPAMAAGAAQ